MRDGGLGVLVGAGLSSDDDWSAVSDVFLSAVAWSGAVVVGAAVPADGCGCGVAGNSCPHSSTAPDRSRAHTDASPRNDIVLILNTYPDGELRALIGHPLPSSNQHSPADGNAYLPPYCARSVHARAAPIRSGTSTAFPSTWSAPSRNTSRRRGTRSASSLPETMPGDLR